jgi:hypothetical protein
MPASTTRGTLPYPLGTDPPDTDGDIRKLAERLAAVGALYLQDTASARPAAGVDGRLFLATDTGVVSYDTGSAWIDLLTQAAANAAYATKAEVSVKSWGAPELAPGRGAPSLATTATYYPVWLLDAAADEGAGVMVRIPAGWTTAKVNVQFVNAGTGTGDVVLRLVYGSHAAGEALSVTAGPEVTAAAAGKDIVQVASLLGSLACDSNKVFLLEVERRGGVAGDTLPNDIGILALILEKVS